MSNSLSSQQLAANRANALLSTGPRTADGKAASSLNAVRTGLTGRAILLSAAEADAYQLHVAHFASHWKPVGDRETELTQSLADTQWRLNRIPVLEAGIYATRRRECAELFLDEGADQMRTLLIETHIWENNRKVFNNLSLQESRLLRRYAKDEAELKALQSARTEKESEKTKEVDRAQPKPATYNSDGFEFSSAPQAGSKPSESPTAPHRTQAA